MDNLIITICARGGSKGVKGKNIRDLNGYPLIYYTIKQARDWGKAKHIIVSTDSEEIAEIAKKYGAEVPFIRLPELATDSAAKVPVIRHALTTSEKIFNQNYEAVMDLDVTSPIRKTEDLDKALNLFLQKKPKTLFSVVAAHRNPYFNMVEETEDGKAVLSKVGNFARRQDAPKVYDLNASIYIYDRKFLVEEKSDNVITDNSIICLMDQISRIDIDSELDFKFIEFLIKKNIISL